MGAMLAHDARLVCGVGNAATARQTWFVYVSSHGDDIVLILILEEVLAV